MKPIKPEKKELFLSVPITPSLNEKIRAFCAEHDVKRSAAARYILEGFFAGDFEISEATPTKNNDDFEKIGVLS